MAICLQEKLGDSAAVLKIQIFATDITNQPTHKYGISYAYLEQQHFVDIQIIPLYYIRARTVFSSFHFIKHQDPLILIYLKLRGRPVIMDSMLQHYVLNNWRGNYCKLKPTCALLLKSRKSPTKSLQSYNEELLSAGEEQQRLNEELETSKEELQSTNEEIITINKELLDRNEQLSQSR